MLVAEDATMRQAIFEKVRIIIVTGLPIILSKKYRVSKWNPHARRHETSFPGPIHLLLILVAAVRIDLRQS